MGWKLYPHRSDRIRLISSADDAIDRSAPDMTERYRRYMETLDERELPLRAEPMRLILRPLTIATWEIACRDGRGLALPGAVDMPVARELLRLSLESVEGWPDEWGRQDDAFSWEYGMRVLSRPIAQRVPIRVCHDAAMVLMSTLPLDSADGPFGP